MRRDHPGPASGRRRRGRGCGPRSAEQSRTCDRRAGAAAISRSASSFDDDPAFIGAAAQRAQPLEELLLRLGAERGTTSRSRQERRAASEGDGVRIAATLARLAVCQSRLDGSRRALQALRARQEDRHALASASPSLPALLCSACSPAARARPVAQDRPFAGRGGRAASTSPGR